jgi:hypothetical protein
VKPLGPAVLLTARPRARLFHLVFGSHIGRALGASAMMSKASSHDTGVNFEGPQLFVDAVEQTKAASRSEQVAATVAGNDDGREVTFGAEARA